MGVPGIYICETIMLYIFFTIEVGMCPTLTDSELSHPFYDLLLHNKLLKFSGLEQLSFIPL